MLGRRNSVAITMKNNYEGRRNGNSRLRWNVCKSAVVHYKPKINYIGPRVEFSSGITVTSSSFTARISSIPSSKGPSTPELPPRRDIPTERMRSRSIETGCVLIVPALVITKPSNGIKTSSHPPSSREKYSRCCHRSSFVGPSVWTLTK